MTAAGAPHGFGSRWRTVRGLRLHALESAAGPGLPAVLMPGLVTASRSMVPLARALAARGMRVWILDPPGFGYSDKPPRSLSIREQAALAAEWLAAIGCRPARLLGNSFGCQVAAAVAARHPGAVGRLVLLSPTARPAVRQRLRWLRALPGPATSHGPPPQDQPPQDQPPQDQPPQDQAPHDQPPHDPPAGARERMAGDRMAGDRMAGDGGACDGWPPVRWRVRLLRRLHAALGDEPPLRVLNVAEYGCASLPRAAGTLRGAVLEPIERELPLIPAPALVIRADRDRLSSPEWAGRLAALAPDGRLARLPGLSHDAFYQAADTVAAVAAPFLAAPGVAGPGRRQW